MKRLIATAMALMCAAGCGTVNSYLADKRQTVEYFRNFDIKTSATRQAIAKAARDGLGRNVNEVQEAMPILNSADIPEKPGRINLSNPLAGSTLAALVGGAGTLGLRVASCDGAVWTARATRHIPNSNNLDLTVCLFQYKEGYHLNLYAIYTKREGGVFQLSRDMAYAMVGTPEEWTEKTFLDVVRTINASVTGQISLLEAQPEMAGTPWLDSLDQALTPKR